ncbi:MAG: hypothetical protein J4G04_08130 [Nitrosopumilaceae archaeon]|nr:hypothetical protein [Nitrosopumilaceae archaeon]
MSMAAGQVNPVVGGPAPVSAVFDGSGGFSALGGAYNVEVFEGGGRTYAIVAAWGDDGVQIMDITNPVHPAPVSAVFDGSGGFSALGGATNVAVFEGGGRTYAIVAAGSGEDGVQIMDVTPPNPDHLDVAIDITGYERVSHSGNDFVQFTISITNHEFTTLTNDNRDGTARSGEINVSLNALSETHPHTRTTPACDAVQGHCAWSNGEYLAYHDMTREQAESRGVAVSEDDCTAWDGWSIRRGETAEARFCYWVDSGFEPEAIQFYRTSADRAQTIPFLDYGSCHLPYMQCNEAALTPLPEEYTRTVLSPDPPLTHAIYDTTTAKLLLVFSEPVIVIEADNISLIHDMAAYNENGTAAALGSVEVHTVDGQSRSPILAFSVDNSTHANMLEAIDSGAGIRLAVGANAIYAADGFADIFTNSGRQPPAIIDVETLR